MPSHITYTQPTITISENDMMMEERGGVGEGEVVGGWGSHF
jgi:hypothetical protein